MSSVIQKDEYKSFNRLFILVFSSISLFILSSLLLWTQYFNDSSILYMSKLIFIGFLFALFPIIFIFFPIKKYTKYITLVSCFITFCFFLILFMYRNKTTICWVPNDYVIKDESVLLKNLQARIYPAGNIIFIGKEDLKFKTLEVEEFTFSNELHNFDLKLSKITKSNDSKVQTVDNEIIEVVDNVNQADSKSSIDNKKVKKVEKFEYKHFEAVINLLNKYKVEKDDITAIKNLKSLKIMDIRFSDINIINKRFIRLSGIEYLPKDINNSSDYRKKCGIIDISEFDNKESKNKDQTKVEKLVVDQEKEQENVEEQVPEIIQNVEEQVPEITEQVEKQVPEITEQVEERLPEIIEEVEERLPEITEQVEEQLSEITEQVEEQLSEITEQVEEQLLEITEQVEETGQEKIQFLKIKKNIIFS